MPNADIPIEPFDDIHYYSFIKASRFLYFCNGYGNLYEVEFHTGASWTIRSLPFEEGASPLTKSYILGSYDQVRSVIFQKKFTSAALSKLRLLAFLVLLKTTTDGLLLKP